MSTWRFDKEYRYTTKSAYKDIINHNLEVLQYRMQGIWNCILEFEAATKSEEFSMESLSQFLAHEAPVAK